jgi:hypothetical protein
MAREVKEVNPEQDRLLDELLRGKTPEQILGEHGLIKQMTKRLVERALHGKNRVREQFPLIFQLANIFSLSYP